MSGVGKAVRAAPSVSKSALESSAQIKGLAYAYWAITCNSRGCIRRGYRNSNYRQRIAGKVTGVIIYNSSVLISTGKRIYNSGRKILPGSACYVVQVAPPLVLLCH